MRLRRAAAVVAALAISLTVAAFARPASSGRHFDQPSTPPHMTAPHFLGLRTAKYTTSDLARAKAWYSEVLGIQPYFDEPFYVGFNVGGFELGIVPEENAAARRAESGVAYWGVGDAKAAYARLIQLGATEHEPIQDVGGDIKIGSVWDPFGNVLGVIENPSFKVGAP